MTSRFRAWWDRTCAGKKRGRHEKRRGVSVRTDRPRKQYYRGPSPIGARKKLWRANVGRFGESGALPPAPAARRRRRSPPAEPGAPIVTVASIGPGAGQLSAYQARVLAHLLEVGISSWGACRDVVKVHSPYANVGITLRSLASRELVVIGKKGGWDRIVDLTDHGRDIARALRSTGTAP